MEEKPMLLAIIESPYIATKEDGADGALARLGSGADGATAGITCSAGRDLWFADCELDG